MNKKALSERDICTKYITPALKDAGWDELSQIREEVTFTKGRIIVRGRLVTLFSNIPPGWESALARGGGPRPSFGITICDPSARRAIELVTNGDEFPANKARRFQFIIHRSSLIIP
jgi:hypothetical protein